MVDRIFRADVWFADFDHTEIDPDGNTIYNRFREHGGKRPCIVLSNNDFNKSSAELVIVVPITSQDKNVPTHVPIEPPEGGLRHRSFVICEGVRSIARQFLIAKWGRVQDVTMQEIELVLRRLMLF